MKTCFSNKWVLASANSTLTVSLLFFCGALLLSLPTLAATQRVAGLEEVDQVHVYGSVEVEISQGAESELLLRGSDASLQRQPFYVRGNTLVLGRSVEHRNANFSDVKYKLTLPELSRLQLQGSGQVYLRKFVTPRIQVIVDGTGDIRLFDIESEEASFRMSGSGDIQAARVAVEQLRLNLSGSGDIHLGETAAQDTVAVINGSGDISVREPSYCDNVEISIIGSGDVDMRKLDGVSFAVKIVGSGTARIGVAQSLDVSILGSGDTFYRGEPQVSQSVLGSGELHRQPQ
ncbi:GIN domain-containing protein [Kineobactrum salinum]|uniref:DUF2807 domain-containing protein n=1 Tax=Kineobactrum salinum TaxID=2708301 RepID=A0A6C0U7J0_9GAMM|nr:DUF2807 domain-containing protein [Kineobactrum salinum]QIB66947.1 DUF2807 domain-containing protein [Kineobactrum salinum]